MPPQPQNPRTGGSTAAPRVAKSTAAPRVGKSTIVQRTRRSGVAPRSKTDSCSKVNSQLNSAIDSKRPGSMDDVDVKGKGNISMREYNQNPALQKTYRTMRSSRNNEPGPVIQMTRKPTVELKKTDPTKFDYKAFLDRHYNEKMLGPGVKKPDYTIDEYEQVLGNAALVFEKETTLIDVDPPVTIVGDIHGQYNDLINIFLLHGRPPERRYLFLGDYVDRGGMSIACAMLLMAYKTFYPNDIFLLRGNHELARTNKRYGFHADCLQIGEKGEYIWALFQKVFNYMPVCALVGTKILCMHGGLSPEMDSIEKIRKISKPIRNPFRGLVSDMMWADPTPFYLEWRNSRRGSGMVFGMEAVNNICEEWNIDLVVRAHQVCLDGFATFGGRVVTLFSAPSYCNNQLNAGAIMQVSTELECQFIGFVPDMKNAEARIKNGKLWDETIMK